MLFDLPIAFTFSQVENLPAAPLPIDWLLERPLPLFILILSVGAVATMIFASRADGRRALRAVLLTLVAATGLYALSRFVVTEREVVMNRTRSLINAVAVADPRTVNELLSEHVLLTTGGQGVNRTRDWLLEVTAGLTGEIESHSITPRGVALDDPMKGSARSRISVSTTFSSSARVPPGTIGSSWELTWKREADGQWRITGIDCLSLMGGKPDASWVRWGDSERSR